MYVTKERILDLRKIASADAIGIFDRCLQLPLPIAV